MIWQPPFGYLGNKGDNAAVPTDGPGPYKVPQNASNFYKLGITPPQSLYLCQESTGTLADSIDSVPLPAVTGPPLPTYSNIVLGWTRKSVNTTETTNQGFTAGGGTAPDPAVTSVAFGAYVKITGTPGGPRDIMGISGVNGVKVIVLATGKLRISCKNVTTDGTINHNTGNVVFIQLLYNRTAGTVKVVSNLETFSGTYASTLINNTKGLGATGASAGPLAFLWAFIAAGATAESYGAGLKTALGW